MKNAEFAKRAIRHGEVIITPVDRLPEGLEEIEKSHQVVIGHSESGHHHIAVSEFEDITVLRPAGADSQDLYLKVASRARVEHLKSFDRHETKFLEPGLYEIHIKTGYDYFLKRTVNVQD